jgi:hypothetical protein
MALIGSRGREEVPGREEVGLDLSPELMALLDHLLLQHTFDTDHLFVVLKENAKDKWAMLPMGVP